MDDKIFVKGAREHNLKNIDVEIPRNSLTVITGLSGSGKSSLAFDTIFAEGQRRYIESLSSYARQFLGQMEKPDVDYIDGLSPAISIDQKSSSHNPRSTVGTVTEIYDYLRLLFARVGIAYCTTCNREISKQSLEQIVNNISKYPPNNQLELFAPVVRGRKGEYSQLFYDLFHGGFAKVRVNGKIYSLDETIALDRYKAHSIEVLVDRFKIQNVTKNRITETAESALKLAKGLIIVSDLNTNKETIYSQNFACPYDDTVIEEITPRSFSFNSPFGACEDCHGLSFKTEIDQNLIIPNKKLSINQGAIMPWTYSKNNYYGALLKAVAEKIDIDLNDAIEKLPDYKLDYILNGPKKSGTDLKIKYFAQSSGHYFMINFKGLANHLLDRYNNTQSEGVKNELSKYFSSKTCQTCKGSRLKKQSLAIKVHKLNIADLVQMSVEQLFSFFMDTKFSEQEMLIAERIIKEIQNRLNFLISVGIGYLTLDRSAITLSGGESQRIRLASQVGSQLVGVLYVLDEPTIGLHQKDNQKLINTLKDLRDLGNTVLVVEHDEETMRQADYLIDVGPKAGKHGGKIVASGKLDDFLSQNSLTAQYLKGELKIEIPKNRKSPKKGWLVIKGAKENNLKTITVKIPLGLMTVVTGVSGSGKSTLVNDIIYKALARKIYRSHEKPGNYEQIEGDKNIDKVIVIDQSPIGRTPRSNSATYTKAFDHIRQLFARTPSGRTRGYTPGRFSFNVDGGRCDHCNGDGIIKIEMHFLPDVFIPCEICRGSRYNKETLEVKYKNKNIADVLKMTIDEASEFFANIPQIERKMATLQQVGLGYLSLGQSATTLSGGEAQRIKLSSELSKIASGNTFYILDEPTTGLHFEDVKKLLGVLKKLVDKGNSVLIIEHNLDVIKSADWIIDLGPEGGENGGRIIATGIPEEVADNPKSYTGEYLKKVLNN